MAAMKILVKVMLQKNGMHHKLRKSIIFAPRGINITILQKKAITLVLELAKKVIAYHFLPMDLYFLVL